MEDNQVVQPDMSGSEPAQQKMLSQDEVNKIVAREKGRAADSARREAEEKYQRDLEALNAQRVQQDQRNTQVPRDFDSNAMYQQFTERFNREMQERQLKEQMSQVAGNYLQNIAKGKAAYEDFDEVTGDFDPTAFPQVVYLLAGDPQAADVLYDLSKNPMKLASINSLAEKNPQLAKRELAKLSKSIVDNRQAQSEAQTQNVSEPLDRLQSSRVAGNNGKMGIKDLRSQPWLRG